MSLSAGIGLGTLGLPPAIAFAHAGCRVPGIHVDQRTVDAITRGHGHIQGSPPGVVARFTPKPQSVLFQGPNATKRERRV